MSAYIFEMDRLTIGDYRTLLQSIETGDVKPFLDVVGRCSVIDIYELPMAELQALLSQFTLAFKGYAEQAQDKHENDEMPEAMRMLRRVFGGKP